MPEFSCQLCDYITHIKCNYIKHTNSRKHQAMAELLPHLDLPPTELERLRIENKRLKEQIADLRRLLG